MSTQWASATQGVSGLWFKPGIDSSGKKHLLVSDTRTGVDGGSHEHWWKNSDGTYGVQLRDRSGKATTIDLRGHIFEHNSKFFPMTKKYLDNLFNRFF